jgi:hypothetical protein
MVGLRRLSRYVICANAMMRNCSPQRRLRTRTSPPYRAGRRGGTCFDSGRQGSRAPIAAGLLALRGGARSKRWSGGSATAKHSRNTPPPSPAGKIQAAGQRTISARERDPKSLFGPNRKKIHRQKIPNKCRSQLPLWDWIYSAFLLQRGDAPEAHHDRIDRHVAYPRD